MSPRDTTLTRRRFLGRSAAAALALPAAQAIAGAKNVKIDRIELFPLRYPTVGYFKFFKGPGASYGRAAVLVKITADDGTFGWGQSIPVATWCYETLGSAYLVMRDYFAPALAGRDPLDIAGAHKAMDAVLAPALTRGMPLSRAGLDLALYDLAGRLTGRSLHQLLDRPRGEPITLSWTVNVRTLDETAEVVEAGRKRGYRNFNIKVAPDPEFDVQLARRIKKLAPEGFLWADANGGYDPETALKAAPRLADAGVDVLESPVPPNQFRAYQALRRQGALPILMDEGVISPVELVEFLRLKMCDGVAMKPSRTGGIFWCRRQIEIIEQEGLMWLGSGLSDPDIAMAASLGLYAAYGMKKPAALNGPQFVATDVLKQPLSIQDGVAQIPTGPGLGIEVDERKVLELVDRSKKEHKGETEGA